jgi:Protein of unknown function (DUF3592)
VAVARRVVAMSEPLTDPNPMTDPNPVTYGSADGTVQNMRAGTSRDGDAWVSKIGYLFAAVAFGLLTAAALTYVSKSKFLDRAVRAEGTVVGVEVKTSRSSNSSRSTTSTYPVVEFQARNEQRVRFTPNTSMSNPEIGQRVSVLYDPSKPGDATLSGFGNLWLLPIILGSIGLFFAGFAVLILKVLRRA